MNRIVAIDWVRGIVMVLMALDHASMVFNAGRVANDSIVTHAIGLSFVAEQFFTRWITHLSAPTFVFLTGTAMALSIMQRHEKGVDSKAIDNTQSTWRKIKLMSKLWLIITLPTVLIATTYSYSIRREVLSSVFINMFPFFRD